MPSMMKTKRAKIRPRLFERRQTLSLSVDQLAKATGLTSESIKDCEAGRASHSDAIKTIDRALRRLEGRRGGERATGRAPAAPSAIVTQNTRAIRSLGDA